jgi:Tol biopolymer transport system component
MSPGGNGVALEGTAVSGDGRYLAFASTAANLVAGDTNGVLDVFVFDRTTCAVERVSVSSAQAQGNFGSVFPAISRDGRFVAFLRQQPTSAPQRTRTVHPTCSFAIA